MEAWITMTSKNMIVKLGLDTVVAVTVIDFLGPVISPILIGVGIAIGNVFILLMTHTAKKTKGWLRSQADELKKHTSDDIDKLIDSTMDKLDTIIDSAVDDVTDEINKKTGGVKDETTK